MKKKIPSSITVFGRKVLIKQGHNLMYDGKRCLGLCDYDNRIIYLEKDQSEEMMLDTLLHELQHFFLEFSGFSQKMSESENEVSCQLFTAFYQDLRKVL